MLLVAACAGRRPAQGDPSRRTTQDTLPPFTTAPVRRPATIRAPVLLRAATAAADSGLDRLVFAFSGDSLPGYDVAYAAEPVRRCGSGERVQLAGTAQLLVEFVPAQAHDDSGRVTVRERGWTPRMPALRDVRLVCDFEGRVEWAIGVAGRRPYRVREATHPARLIVEARHP